MKKYLPAQMKCDLKVTVAVASYVYMQHTINVLPITRVREFLQLHFQNCFSYAYNMVFYFLLIDDR